MEINSCYRSKNTFELIADEVKNNANADGIRTNIVSQYKAKESLTHFYPFQKMFQDIVCIKTLNWKVMTMFKKLR